MEKGERIYYTGDMANVPSAGVITSVRPSNEWGPESYDVRLDDGREILGVYGSAFEPQPGRRFWPMNEYQADRQRRIDEMNRDFARAAAVR